MSNGEKRGKGRVNPGASGEDKDSLLRQKSGVDL